ncbi:WGG domain-containing protein [Cephalotus follicularis]|uniref:WGG domain-containing protein n=1 Tax=Cephalotus follicularis TaxID=3775 RepID=A0A1Q3BPT2_CEPFO|nr:WGG domain-containing protein [Cephalotus follicularis]
MNGDSGPTLPRKQLRAESVTVFQEGIALTLSRWSALQLAVENEWGGRDSRRIPQLLASDIFSWFTHSKEPLYIDDLENILDEGIVSLNTIADDGSIEEVSKKLMIMHEECLEGNYQSIEIMRETASQTVARSHIRQVVDDNDDDMEDEDSSNMMVDGLILDPNSVERAVNEPRPEEVAAGDNDGWVVVSSKRYRGKRN